MATTTSTYSSSMNSTGNYVGTLKIIPYDSSGIIAFGGSISIHLDGADYTGIKIYGTFFTDSNIGAFSTIEALPLGVTCAFVFYSNSSSTAILNGSGSGTLNDGIIYPFSDFTWTLNPGNNNPFSSSNS